MWGNEVVYYDGLKGGLVRLSKSAFTWSTMVNTSSRMEKCTRKAFMTP